MGQVTHHEVRLARQRLGLSVRQMAKILKTDPQSVRRMEMEPSRSTSRNPSPRIEEIILKILRD